MSNLEVISESSTGIHSVTSKRFTVRRESDSCGFTVRRESDSSGFTVRRESDSCRFTAEET